MIPGIFVAGTGTDVGKTVVTAGILRFLRRHGEEAIAMKPVQTGCEADAQGRMRAPDVDFVLQAAGLTVDDETLAHLAPYCYAPACSPHLAARMAGQRIEMGKILASAQWLAERYRRLVVEGAGGVLVPLNDTQMMLSIAWELEMPVLLVGHSGLGAINHVLLSLEAIRRRGCHVLGVMLNDTHPVRESESFIHEDNVVSIRAFGKVPVTRIPYLRSAPGAPLHPGKPTPGLPGTPLDVACLDAALDACEFLNLYESIAHE